MRKLGIDVIELLGEDGAEYGAPVRFLAPFGLREWGSRFLLGGRMSASIILAGGPEKVISVGSDGLLLV